MSFKDGRALVVRTCIAVSKCEGDGKTAPCSATWVHNYLPPLNVRAHNCYNCFSVSFHEFSTRGGGEVPPSSEACHGTESPDTKRWVPSLHL